MDRDERQSVDRDEGPGIGCCIALRDVISRFNVGRFKTVDRDERRSVDRDERPASGVVCRRGVADGRAAAGGDDCMESMAASLLFSFTMMKGWIILFECHVATAL